MKKTILVQYSRCSGSLLPALAALVVSTIAATGCATSGTPAAADASRHDQSASHHDSDPVGPDYYSSNDNPFHSD